MTARRTLSVTGTANRDQLHPTLTYKDTSNYKKMEEPLFESPKCRIFGIISGFPQYPEWKNSKSVLELLEASRLVCKFLWGVVTPILVQVMKHSKNNSL